MDIEKLRKDAEAGSLTSQAILGSCYFEGYGVEKDYVAAFRYLVRPAEQGVPRACYYLGRLYLEGLGVRLSVEKAARLFEFAAERNEFYAKIELARMHARGVLGAENRGLASKWYAAAVAQEQSVSGCDEELNEAKNYLA